MNLLKYVNSIKNIPDRFSNLAFWRCVRKLKDCITSALDYINMWGSGIENSLSEINTDLSGLQTWKTSVDSSLSGLQEWKTGVDTSLSDKLPKSPTDWETWSVDEQDIARERIAADGEWQCVTLNANDYDSEHHRFTIDVGEVKKITEVYGIGQVQTNSAATVDLKVGIGFGNENNYSYGAFGN